MRSSHDKFISSLMLAKNEGRWVFVLSRFSDRGAEVHNFVGVVADISPERLILSRERVELRVTLDMAGSFEYSEFQDIPPEAQEMKATLKDIEFAIIMRSRRLKTMIQIGIGKRNTKPLF